MSKSADIKEFKDLLPTLGNERLSRLREVVAMMQRLVDTEAFLDGSFDLKALAEVQKGVGEFLEALGDIKSNVQGVYDVLRKSIIPDIMLEQGIQSIRIDNVGIMYKEADVLVSVKKENEPDLFTWLDDNGHGGLIKPTVNANSLKALVKKKIKEGEEYPEDIIKTHPYFKTIIKG